jgi:hypothetical protein
MNDHQHDHQDIQDLLPFYAAGTLAVEERQRVANHLTQCETCRADLAFWGAVDTAIEAENTPLAAPPQVLARALEKKPARLAWPEVLSTWFSLLKTQIRLVRAEIWSASGLVLGLGFVVAVLLERAGFLYALAPLVAAAGMALIYGEDNDPVLELTLSTPVSQSQILLARLVLVFGYDLALVLAATAGLRLFLGEQIVLALLFEWLAPMAFLSSLGLLLSLVVGPSNAVTATYLVWLGRYILTMPEIDQIAYTLSAGSARFWSSPPMLLGLAGALLLASAWIVRRQAGNTLVRQ